MNRHALSAVFLKDLRQLWPLALLCAIVIPGHALLDSNWLHNAAFLASGIFIIALVQQDAPASLRHDWLTRPVGSLDVLLAKIVLAGAAILLPAVLGAAIVAARHGAAVPGALLPAIAGMQINLLLAFALFLVAAVTATPVQAAGVLVGLFLFQTIARPLPDHIETAPVPGFGVWGVIVLVTLGGGAVVLWLQYAHRRTLAARGALLATIGVLTLAMALLSGAAAHAPGQAKSAQLSGAEASSVASAATIR